MKIEQISVDDYIRILDVVLIERGDLLWQDGDIVQVKDVEISEDRIEVWNKDQSMSELIYGEELKAIELFQDSSLLEVVEQSDSIESDSLTKLMELGYNVNIECKGKVRVYEMTFEATAKRIKQENEDEKEYLISIIGETLHAVGNTIEEVSSNLLTKVMSNSESLKTQDTRS